MATSTQYIASSSAQHQSSLKTVTVFKSSKAEIVRQFPISLVRGKNIIEIEGLSSSIDTKSLRVSGFGGNARLNDVVCSVDKKDDNNVESSELRELKKKRRELERLKSVSVDQYEVLNNYSKSLTGAHLLTEELSAFMDIFHQQGSQNRADLDRLDEQIEEIDQQLESAVSQTKTSNAKGRVKLVVDADQEASLQLKLTYVVSGAEWSPTYELHATSSGPTSELSTVSLQYRARVMQSTGEDWDNTSLILSGLSSNLVNPKLPDLKVLKIVPGGQIGFGPGVRAPQSNVAGGKWQPNVGLFGVPSNAAPASGFGLFGQPASGPFGSTTNATSVPAFGSFGNTNSTSAPAPGGIFGSSTMTEGTAAQPVGGFGTSMPQPQPASAFAFAAAPETAETTADPPDVDPSEGMLTEPETVITETAVATTYTVRGETTIPSDGLAHQVSIATLNLEARTSCITLPRVDPKVYLQCVVKNTSEYRLLPGPVSIILDDSYASQSQIGEISTGDTFHCILGTDVSLSVTHTRKSKTEATTSGPFSQSYRTTTYTTVTTIRNRHNYEVKDLNVLDSLPVTENKNVNVILRQPELLSEAKEGEVINVLGTDVRVEWEKQVSGKGGISEGRLRWIVNVKNGETTKLVTKFDVKAPSNIWWTNPYAN